MNVFYQYFGMASFWLIIIYFSLLYPLSWCYRTFISWYKKNIYISTFRVWRKHAKNKLPIGTDNYKWLKAILENKDKQIESLPDFMKRIWYSLAEQRLQELRNEILIHGETPSF